MGHSFWDRLTPKRNKPPVVPPPPAVTLTAGPLTPIRVTLNDIAINRGYSYYSQSWLSPDGIIKAFCGIVGKRPQFFSVALDNKITELGALIPHDGEAEGWYFDANGDVYLCHGPRLKRINITTGVETVVLDISETRPGHDLWQAHSSEDGQTHSATVRQIVDNGQYPKIGTIVQRLGTQSFYPATGTLDESQITADGSYLIIKETDEQDRLYNLVKSLVGEADYPLNPGEAIGHSDCGLNFVVGEDSAVGQCIRFNPRNRERQRLFDTWNLGHVSVRGRRILHTGDESMRLVNTETGNVTPLVPHGMAGTGYDYQVHANLDPSGRVAAWVSNQAGQMDLYVMRLPALE